MEGSPEPSDTARDHGVRRQNNIWRYFYYGSRFYEAASRSRCALRSPDPPLEPSEFQQRWTQEHWMLQYDLMFGKGYALTRMGLESVAEPAKGK